MAKRLFDIAFSGLGLLLSLPVWVMIGLAIKLEDGGPVFYGQERVGRYGRRFKSWKFRSMIVNADQKFDALQARERDPRITGIGRILRATALDELPQLWNIFCGEMSVVGPRALLGAEIEVNGTGELVPIENIPGYHARHEIRPGLTGIAQIYADRDIPRRHKFRYDLVYVRAHSFWLDVRLIALSFWITFRGKWEQRGGKLPKTRPKDGDVIQRSDIGESLGIGKWLGIHASRDGVMIQPSRGWVRVDLREVWQYRELLYFLTWRDIKVRYKQTVLGAAWAIIQPFFMMLVFSVFLGHLGKIPSDGIPYPIFVYAGLLSWQLFAHALSQSSNSLVGNARLITKVYFPRLIIPISAVCGGLVDFGISFLVLLGMMMYYGVHPGPAVLAVPLLAIFTTGTALAVGLWLSALNVQYRDVHHILGFLTPFWLFLTPVAYPASLVPEKWRAIYGLNPMAGVVEAFRWAVLGNGDAPKMLLSVSACVVALILVGGLHYFVRMEETVIDLA